MKKKGLLSLVLILVLTAFLAACSGSNTASNSTNNNASQTTNTSNSNNTSSANNNDGANTEESGVSDTIDEPVTIAITNLGGSSVEQNEAMFGKAIREKFPNVTIEWKQVDKERRIEHLILDGENIDLYIVSIGNFFNVVPQNGLNYDMTELAEKYDVDLSGIDPAMVEPMIRNTGGELWAVPVFNSSLIIYYNKDMFDEFGVDYPTDGMTWDEIFELAKNFNVTKDGKDYVGFAISNHHHTKLNNFGLEYVSPETELSTYDNEKWKSILNVFARLGEDPGYRNFMNQKEKPGPADSQDFYDGKAAMLGTIVHHIGNENFRTMNFDWDMVAYPAYDEQPGIGSQAYPTYVGIPPFAEQKDAAMKIIKFLISEEFQMEASRQGNMPVLTNPEVQAVYGTAEYADKNVMAPFYNKFAPVMHKTPYDGDVEKAVTQYLADIALGNIDINTALRQAKEQADQKIAEKKL